MIKYQTAEIPFRNESLVRALLSFILVSDQYAISLATRKNGLPWSKNRSTGQKGSKGLVNILPMRNSTHKHLNTLSSADRNVSNSKKKKKNLKRLLNKIWSYTPGLF
jgi:hypothetical protein